MRNRRKTALAYFQHNIFFESSVVTKKKVARILNRKVGARAIHGDKSAEQRRYLINDFRKGKFTALVATDVASRGLDIPGKD